MALVEASHYTDDEGLRRQVGQYSAPPPVRLQRGGLGKLAVAFVAALGSGAAMFYAVTAVPVGQGGGEAVVTMAAPAQPLEQSAEAKVGVDQAAGSQSLNAERQLALLAGDAVSLQTGPALSVVDLNGLSGAPGLLVPSEGEPGTLAAATPVVIPPVTDVPESSVSQSSVPMTTVPQAEQGSQISIQTPVQKPSGQEALQETVLVEHRVPLPKHKPEMSGIDPAPQTQLASADLSAEHPQTADGKTGGGDSVASHQAEIPPAHTAPSTPAPEAGFRQAAATGDVAGSEQFSEPATVRFSSSGPVLNPAPWVRITERSANGLLPVTGPNGETSRSYYARPFPANEKRPRISIVIGGLGLSQKATAAAIDRLPAEVTLAFAPYGKNLQTSINRARSRGHEVLLELPMEPFDYPTNDPGPFTLLTNNNSAQNSQRLEWLLAQFNGYVGVTNYLGAKFTSTPEALMPVLRELDERGLLVLDDGTSSRSLVASLSRKMHVPYRTASRTVDLRVSRAAIDDALLDLENVTRRQGSAVGMGYAYPVTIDRILMWVKTLEQKGFVLAPVSANVQGSENDTGFDQHASSY